MQAVKAKQTDCDRLAQHASDDISDDAVPLQVDNATSKEIVTAQIGMRIFRDHGG